MTKKMMALAILAACMGASMCGTVGAQADSLEREAEPEDPAVYLEQVAEANSLEAMQEKYGVIAAISQYYFEDGTVQSQYVYKDSERYIFEYEGNVTVDEDGDVYGFYEAEKLPYRMLFTDGAYDEYKYAETLTNWEMMCGLAESGIATFERGEAEQTFWQEAGIDYAENGFDVKAEDRIGNVFVVDSATKEITEFRRILVRADGTEAVLQEGKLRFDAENIEPDAEMKNQIFSDDSRAVTLVADPGTADEKVYRQTVGKGCMIQFCLGPEYDGQVYEDDSCTMPYYDGEGDHTGDLTVYAKRMSM